MGKKTIPWLALIAALAAADQAVKFLVRRYIPQGGSVRFIPYVMDLTYVKNTGAAFSLFSRHTWLLAVLSAVASAALLLLLFRSGNSPALWKLPLSLVIAGAMGNLIDRIFLGFVTDMFRTLFINFAIFNVADICITLGGVGCAVYLIFFYKEA